MPKLVEFKKNKEYVFVSPRGNLHIFRFTTRNKKKIVLVKKEDALNSVGLKTSSFPMVGDFVWPRDLIFGRKGLKFKYIGEL
jgi:hypothetical protein